MKPHNEHAEVKQHARVASGSGLLTTGSGAGKTVTTVTSPIALGDGNHKLIDNESNAVITGGNGDNRITELGAGATITLGNGGLTVTDLGGTATVTTGTGDQRIILGGAGNTVTVGATHGGANDVTFIQAGIGNATVMAGDGNMVIAAGGANNAITAGNGNDVFLLGGNEFGHGEGRFHQGGTIPATSDHLNLGNGSNWVFLSGSGNTIADGTGNDTIFGAQGGNDTFVLNAAGGTLTVGGFNLTNGDSIDLSKILAGLPVDQTTIANYVSLTTQADSRRPSQTDTTLTVTGSGGTDTITLLNTGTITLAGLSAHSVVF